MKNMVVLFVMLGLVFAQMPFSDVSAPSDGLSWHWKRFADSFRLGFSDLIGSQEDRIALRLEIQRDYYKAMAKEYILNHPENAEVINQDIEEFQAETEIRTLSIQNPEAIERVSLALENHKQVLDNVRIYAPPQAQTALENAIERSSRLEFLATATPEELQEIGLQLGAEGSPEAFDMARLAYLETGDEQVAAEAFRNAGGILPEQNNPETHSDLIIQQNIITEVTATGPENAFDTASKVYEQTGSAEAAQQAFINASGVYTTQGDSENVTN